MSNEHKALTPLDILLGDRRIVLGSASPRRIALLSELFSSVEIRPAHIDENYDPSMDPHCVPEFLSKAKAADILPTLGTGEILVTADTVVILEGELIGKPLDREHAHHILERLSGHTHTVVTGYALTDVARQVSGSVQSYITFAGLTEEEITYYLDHYQVMDKAGAYGVQEWIGLVGVSEIQGSYHNIMGLPTAALYRELKIFLQS